MPVPDFDHVGLLPIGIHNCTIDEIEQRFTWNQNRSAIWAGFRQFAAFLVDQGLHYPLFINGGFVTDRADPSDVDVCLDLRDGATDEHQKDALFLFMLRRGQIRNDYKVDFCPSFPGQNDFSEYFQYVGIRTAAAKRLQPTDKKGILRIVEWAPG